MYIAFLYTFVIMATPKMVTAINTNIKSNAHQSITGTTMEVC
jgi:hypothetical protein